MSMVAGAFGLVSPVDQGTMNQTTFTNASIHVDVGQCASLAESRRGAKFVLIHFVSFFVSRLNPIYPRMTCTDAPQTRRIPLIMSSWPPLKHPGVYYRRSRG